MNRAELIEAFRSDVGDEKEPFLWTEADVQRYLDDAISEACDRARLIRDTTTAAICEITVTALTASYALDGRILHFERAKLDNSTVPLEITSTAALDASIPAVPRTWRPRSSFGYWSAFGSSWETAKGRPNVIAIDREGAGWTGRLVPIPTSDTVLRLHVFRGPLESLTEDADEPEGIESRLHLRLLDWMKHLAYSKQDTETKDAIKAMDYADRFTLAFGGRIDANQRRLQENNAPHVVEFVEF
jgi:hypothetical protein